jgi:hypothetical protein
MPFLAAGTPEFFDWQAAFAGVQFDDEVPAEPIEASAAPDPEPEQPDGPTAPTPPPQTTLADPKHFAHRLFADCAREQAGPSGRLKGRPRSYEPYEPSAYEDVEFYGQDSDDQHSE